MDPAFCGGDPGQFPAAAELLSAHGDHGRLCRRPLPRLRQQRRAGGEHVHHRDHDRPVLLRPADGEGGEVEPAGGGHSAGGGGLGGLFSGLRPLPAVSDPAGPRHLLWAGLHCGEHHRHRPGAPGAPRRGHRLLHAQQYPGHGGGPLHRDDSPSGGRILQHLSRLRDHGGGVLPGCLSAPPLPGEAGRPGRRPEAAAPGEGAAGDHGGEDPPHLSGVCGDLLLLLQPDLLPLPYAGEIGLEGPATLFFLVYSAAILFSRPFTGGSSTGREPTR